MIKNHFIILFSIAWRGEICKICKTFAIEHKNSKFNAKVSTNYRIIGLYFKYKFCDIFVASKSLDFFFNVFNTKAIKICHIITICIKSYLVCSCIFVLIKICYVYRLVSYSVNKHPQIKICFGNTFVF